MNNIFENKPEILAFTQKIVHKKTHLLCVITCVTTVANSFWSILGFLKISVFALYCLQLLQKKTVQPFPTLSG